jgi:signal transduction histidine kinase
MSNMKLKMLMVLSMLWTLFTLALVAWWMVFTVSQLENMRTGQIAGPAVYLQQERMIKAEGGALLFLLVLGGVGLVGALWQLQKQHEKIRSFFSVFTHEIKTSLARLILKSDLMAEENPNSRSFQEFKEETTFLQNQLENALWVAKGFGTVFWEKVDWMALIKDNEWSWPTLRWKYSGESFEIRIDRRVFQMVIRNLVQNAIHHGQATEITFRAERKETQWNLWIEDNGIGFKGDFKRLGNVMERATNTSGTGIGLWVVTQGVLKLHGQIHFYATPQGGFGVQLVIPLGQIS